mmetsp:Transcript_38827/g.91843  ORF Transcript_38827/g.91843 Transcript_38827/m.91843 type:complete len:167 (-) Transcript_38827:56-556(-)|eukprot:CAMPEP_0180117318 /NCGR_PEP_ID=MMETSP0986-20121125/856_1 /TAXON_ID=697907 /ORGANISM="non described non described, Strain CCMP2293" /LENGTH=166 /DNA_ID=CAMNT_0022056187 /DNA_START=161 /DNA_END=661 /DNA_ORIENTATION=-
MASQRMVTLLSPDKQTFQVPWDVAMRSTVVKQMLEDLPEPEEGSEEQPDPVPLMDRSCNANILEKVLDYLQKHHEFDKTGASQEDKDTWDKKYVEVEDEVLFNLILAANFLDIKDLLDLTCKTVAEYIKQCKTPEEIRQRFNIPNDFTPEEEEEVRKENAWCEDAP